MPYTGMVESMYIGEVAAKYGIEFNDEMQLIIPRIGYHQYAIGYH